jgi:glucose/arabinose dehydrogenase
LPNKKAYWESRSTPILPKIIVTICVNLTGTIPTDNPFYKIATGANRSIWALGLRNPYSFGVQRGTGRTYINDVGQNSWEEINQNIRAANYGWPRYEGPETDPKYVAPIFAYQHGSGNDKGCSIVGGAFYNPVTVKFPASYVGDYFFGDFCNGWIRSYDSATKQTALFASGLNLLVDIKVAADGKLYYLERGGGVLTQVIYSPRSTFSTPRKGMGEPKIILGLA